MPAMAEALPREDHISSQEPAICGEVPPLFSAFVDTFVDFVVGGQFLGSIAPSLNQKLLHPAGRKVSDKEDASDEEISADARSKSDPSISYTSEGTESEGEGLLTWLPAPERLIAIGDIHGDLTKAREALRVGHVIDEDDHWIGGKTVVVQVGDLLDRGGEEIKIIYLLEKLRKEAQRAGGDVHIMNGNHEIMNMEGDFRYATHAALDEFRTWAHWYNLGNVLKDKCNGLGKQPDLFQNIPDSYPTGLRARMAALRPGGPIASRFLSKHPTVLVVGGTVFVHGGLLPTHVEHGLDRINEEVRDWMLGRNGWRAPPYLHGGDAVVWLRKYSERKESECDCKLLSQCLSSIDGVKRMVVGHTIQEREVGINGACDNNVIRVDVGMSKGCGDRPPEVLEIRGDRELRVLSTHAPPHLIDTGSTVDERTNTKTDKRPGLASLLPEEPKTYT